MRRILLLGAAAGLAACTGGQGGGAAKPVPPQPPAPGLQVDLAPIPAKIETTTSKPMDGNQAGAHSPLLEIMKAEADRELAELKTQHEPAYYISYEVVEQRVVNLEAEGGAVIADSDETQRNLDSDVRVGTPALDNTHALADDSNGLNAPLTRHGVIPFGDDKQAIASALWLETDRRYREAVNPLGYVRQDQSTLKARQASDDDFSHEPAETHIEPVAKLEFDKALAVQASDLAYCPRRAAGLVASSRRAA